MDAPLRGPREVSKSAVFYAVQGTEHERRRRPETRGRKPALTEAQAGRGLLCSWPFGFRAVKKRMAPAESPDAPSDATADAVEPVNGSLEGENAEGETD